MQPSKTHKYGEQGIGHRSRWTCQTNKQTEKYCQEDSQKNEGA